MGDYVRHNLGCMLHPKTVEDEKEPQQPILVARVTGDDEPKVTCLSCWKPYKLRHLQKLRAHTGRKPLGNVVLYW